MKKVLLPSKVTLAECERILASLGHNPPDRIRLYLPSSLESGGMLASEARLIQLIITIRRKYGTFEIASASDLVSADNNLELLAGRAYALAAFYLGSNYITPDGQGIPRRDLMNKVARYVKAVDRGDYQNTAPEQNANIVMLQGSRIEFPRPFYLDHAPELRDALQITREVESILKTILPSPVERYYIPKLISPIGHSLRELLENIDDHASTDLNGTRLRPSLRAAMFRFHRISREALANSVGATGVLGAFGKGGAIRANLKGQNDIGLLELSIVDSGVGVPSRWCHRPNDEIAFATQVEAVSDAFREGTSTKANTESAGLGLYRLQRLASKLNGVIEIRSGSVLLSNKFSTNDPVATSPAAWNGAKVERAEVAGTRISLIVPIYD